MTAFFQLPFFQPLGIVSFRRYWLASAISLFGDHITFVALPWLVLKLTGDPMAMGMVIAIAAVPRAVFMLFGGALSDRWSPRLVMLVSNFLRFVLIVTLAAMTYFDVVTYPIVVVIAFCFGLADAFLFPAASAMPPRLLETEQLAAGNGLLQSTMQLTLVFGPMVGGMLIALLGDDASSADQLQDRVALATVFAIDALTFVVALTLLYFVRDRFTPEVETETSLMSSVIEGLKWAWQDIPLRMLMLMLATFSMVFRGPFMVGVPALANEHIAEGAAAYGSILSIMGIGSIIGAILAGTYKPRGDHWLGKLLLLDFVVFGSLLIFMSAVHELSYILSLVLIGGVIDGYVIVAVTTWVQRHVPPERMGRVMGVVMFVGQGLFPISSAIAGAVAGWDLLMMLAIGGSLAVITALVGLSVRSFRRMGY